MSYDLQDTAASTLVK